MASLGPGHALIRRRLLRSRDGSPEGRFSTRGLVVGTARECARVRGSSGAGSAAAGPEPDQFVAPGRIGGPFRPVVTHSTGSSAGRFQPACDLVPVREGGGRGTEGACAVDLHQ